MAFILRNGSNIPQKKTFTTTTTVENKSMYSTFMPTFFGVICISLAVYLWFRQRAAITSLAVLGLEKFKRLQHKTQWIIFAFLIYAVFNLVGSLLLNISLTDFFMLPFLILIECKKLWPYIFLLWFSLSLFSILRQFNNTWLKSLEKVK